jgi:flagellum-specific ATP synthase
MRALLEQIEELDGNEVYGRVVGARGLMVEVAGPLHAMSVGARVTIEAPGHRIPCEVVGFSGGHALLMPFAPLEGVRRGCRAVVSQVRAAVRPTDAWLGRVVDAMGRPIDGKGPLPSGPLPYPFKAPPPAAHARRRVGPPIDLGVRALNTFVTCCHGQRMGIFAGSGVGKSSLLGMIARSTSADVNVICLVGERGREVREFIERDLGPEGMARSVVVVATSDQPALVRIKAAFTATTIAEHFRDQGRDVMLMMDSVTRFAMAQREVGLAIGEPPATRGYTPSVFAMLPKLLERSGTAPAGSITGLYTVLVDGDDMNEPIADAVRSILDGHVVLSRDLAHAGHYPAVDVLASVSRLVGEVVTSEVRSAGDDVRRLMAAYREKSDLIAIGAYQQGADPVTDAAIAAREPIDSFLRQKPDEVTSADEADSMLTQLALLSGVSEPAPVQPAEPAPPPQPQAGGTPLHSAIPPLHLAA